MGANSKSCAYRRRIASQARMFYSQTIEDNLLTIIPLMTIVSANRNIKLRINLIILILVRQCPCLFSVAPDGVCSGGNLGMVGKAGKDENSWKSGKAWKAGKSGKAWKAGKSWKAGKGGKAGNFWNFL